MLVFVDGTPYTSFAEVTTVSIRSDQEICCVSDQEICCVRM